MITAAEKFKSALWAAFQKGLQLKLRIAIEKIEMELLEKLQAEAQTLASNEELNDEEGQPEVEKPSLVKEGKPITPVDIFMAPTPTAPRRSRWRSSSASSSCSSST